MVCEIINERNVQLYFNSENILLILGQDLQSIAPVLRAAAVPLLEQETCRMTDINGGRQQPILDTMLCAGN